MSSHATRAKRGAYFIQHAHTGKPATINIRGAPGITYGHAVRASRTIFIKINRLTF